MTMFEECQLIVFLSLLALCIVQGGAQNCNQAVTCSECVSRANCAWCSDTKNTGFRCMDASANSNSGCVVPSGKVGDQTVWALVYLALTVGSSFLLDLESTNQTIDYIWSDIVINSDRCSSNRNLLTFDGPSYAESCPVGGSVFGSQLCSGRGQCSGINCSCEPNTFGQACECDTFSVQCKANPTDTQVCSGRGTCCNQACTCNNSPMGNPYRSTSTLNACQCEPEEEICDYNGRTCNGRGSCGCEGCECLSQWEGSFCQIYIATRCTDSIDTQCIMACRAAGAPENCGVQGTACTENRPTLFVDMARIDTNTDQAVEEYAREVLGSYYRLIRGGGSSARCETILDNGCTTIYYILENNVTRNIAIVVVREENCPVVEDQFQTFPLWSIAVIIVAALVLFGIPIIIIISIILIMRHNRVSASNHGEGMNLQQSTNQHISPDDNAKYEEEHQQQS